MQLEIVYCPIPSLCKVALSVPVPVSLSPTSRCATLLFSISILHCQDPYWSNSALPEQQRKAILKARGTTADLYG
ncbi:auxin response factor 9 isoform X2 [Gossypium australe]|uniref:Auxin response factor 9 isoform X2 n=1 Tax=Gossypium australe TaxID=47621 RepID=A0A5B6UTM5_9ROSI|nr:auxin response factor 9 isoform X2 [Gossypium australe]